MNQGPHGVQAPYSGMHHQQQQQQLSPPAMNPPMPKTSVEGAPGAPTGDVIQVHGPQVSQKWTTEWDMMKLLNLLALQHAVLSVF